MTIERVIENISGGQLEGQQDDDSKSLEELSKDQLIALVIRCNGWQMALKSREEIAEAFKLKLAMSGLAEKDMFKALPIMREWFDREMGKAAQVVQQQVTIKQEPMSDFELARHVEFLLYKKQMVIEGTVEGSSST